MRTAEGAESRAEETTAPNPEHLHHSQIAKLMQKISSIVGAVKLKEDSASNLFAPHGSIRSGRLGYNLNPSGLRRSQNRDHE